MRNWIFVLHFYQPPTQEVDLTEYITYSCYLKILDTLLSNPQAKVTLNLTGSLLLTIESLKIDQFFQKINLLLDRGQIEILLSPIHHQLLPLTPEDVIGELLKKQKALIKKFFPQANPQGIYPPELGIDEKVIKILSKFGNYCLVDESSLNPNWNYKKIHPAIFNYQSLPLLCSSRAVTEIIRSYPHELLASSFIDYLNSITDDNQLIVSVSDAEVFGHHYSERINFLEDILKSAQVNFLTATEALEKYPFKKITKIHPSTWQTLYTDFKKRNFFSLWLDPKNNLQVKYQKLADLAYKSLTTKSTNLDSKYHIAYDHYLKGISSCHSYWISNNPWWHPDLTTLGATQLIKAIRTLPLDDNTKQTAENLYHSLLQGIWKTHWSDKAEKGYKRHDIQRKKFLKLLPELD